MCTLAAEAIVSLTISRMPAAKASRLRPALTDSVSSAFKLALLSRGILPPANVSGESRPRAKFASVTVGNLPPRP